MSPQQQMCLVRSRTDLCHIELERSFPGGPVPHRTFKDQNGRVWDVWDVHPTLTERRSQRQDQDVVIERRKHQLSRPSLPGDLRQGWLAFESKSERRRLAPTPDAWDELTETELVSLLERAVSAKRSKRLLE